MTLENVKKIRKELHHLVNADRDQFDDNGNRTISIPLVIRVNTSYLIDEMTCCVLWDDENEIIYSVELNMEQSGPLNTICPMCVKAYPYESIECIYARLDRLTLDNFFKGAVEKGITTEAVRKRYFDQVEKIYDPRTYVMGQPSITTEKRELVPDDIVMNKEAYKTL